jgi:hypothetical protein
LSYGHGVKGFSSIQEMENFMREQLKLSDEIVGRPLIEAEYLRGGGERNKADAKKIQPGVQRRCGDFFKRHLPWPPKRGKFASSKGEMIQDINS